MLGKLELQAFTNEIKDLLGDYLEKEIASNG